MSYAFRHTSAVAYAYQHMKPTPSLKESTGTWLNTRNSQRYRGASLSRTPDFDSKGQGPPFYSSFSKWIRRDSGKKKGPYFPHEGFKHGAIPRSDWRSTPRTMRPCHELPKPRYYAILSVLYSNVTARLKRAKQATLDNKEHICMLKILLYNVSFVDFSTHRHTNS